MKKCLNPNHPPKGSQIKVDPIKKLKDIENIKKFLDDKPRDLALFTIGINTNLRASDLLNLKVGQVRHLKPMDEIEIKEQKTGKMRRISLNKSCIAAIQRLLEQEPYKDTDYIFKSRRGAVLTVPSVNRLVKEWCETFHLKGNYGSHTLRKTWGYHMRVDHNVAIPVLMECFNHSSQRQTQTYLCIQPEEIRSVYENEL